MHKQQISHLDLAQIAQSGQCFRMNPGPDTCYHIVSRTHVLSVAQQGDELTFDCPGEDLPYWLDYFDSSTDYENIQNSIFAEDAYLKQAALAGQGIRILRQDPWEMILTFIISQQKTIPKIQEAVEVLSQNYGKPLRHGELTFHSFPTAAELTAASLDDLLALKLGYRAKYIHRVCRDCAERRLDLESLEAMDYRAAMTYLTQFYGIGEKVANCICLFGLHHIDAFPVDTWIQKILLREYYRDSYSCLPKNRLWETIVSDHFGQYKGCAGVMQQYIFHYERNVLGGHTVKV